MNNSQEKPNWMVRDDRRSGGDRRQFSYTAHIPERRNRKDRRCKNNKKTAYSLKVENDHMPQLDEAQMKEREPNSHPSHALTNNKKHTERTSDTKM